MNTQIDCPRCWNKATLNPAGRLLTHRWPGGGPVCGASNKTIEEAKVRSEDLRSTRIEG